MDRLIEFVIHHWLLVVAFLILLVLLLIEEARSKGMGGFAISPQKLSLLVNRENAMVIDLREANAFKDGHIAGSKNISHEQITQDKSKLEAYKNKPIILVCSTGQKSSGLVTTLKKLGFSEVYVLNGGIAAWKQASMPLIKK